MNQPIFNTCLSLDNIKQNLGFSWSSLKDFEACEAFWFVRNFAMFPEGVGTPLIRIENTFAAPGSMIQKLFEIFINNRVFLRPEMKTFEDMLNWFKKTHIKLWNLISFPINPTQYTNFKSIKSLKNYFKLDFGALAYAKARKEGLDPQMQDIQPLILEFDIFSKVHGSTDLFHQKMFEVYEKTLHFLKDQNYDLLRLVSEIPLKGEIEGVPIKGYIDFIYSMDRNTWFTPETQNFLILDGKWSVNKFVKKEQLYLYSYLLKLTRGVQPRYLGFLDWQKSKFDYFEYDPNFEQWVHPLVQRAKAKLYELIYKLDREGNKDIPLFEYSDLLFNPSQESCGFCPVLNCCPYAKREKVFSIDTLYGKNIRREAAKEIQELVDSQDSSLIDTTL